MQFVARYSLRVFVALVGTLLIWSCASIPGLRDENLVPIIRIPFVRVLLAESAERAVVDVDGAFAIECLDLGQQTVYYSSQPVAITNVRGQLSVVNEKGQHIQEGMEEVNLIPRGTESKLKINDRRYRGLFKALPYGQGVRIVNVLYIEDYLRGVVPSEIGKREDNEIEAIKAQAVAARTYAMRHLQQYEGEPFDLKATVADQVYDGMDFENKLVNSAIESTAGTVARYDNDFIIAYYHSTCGGMTDDITQVWEKPPLPYLKPVDDSAACSWSKYYVWKERFTEAQLRGRIEQYLSTDRGRDIRVDKILDVQIAERTSGGRVLKLLVRTQTDVYRFYKDRIRWVVGRSSNPDLILQSDRFDVFIERDAQDQMVAVEFGGGGYGHGVGMCQCGAIGKARQGWAYANILRHYYTGIDLERLY